MTTPTTQATTDAVTPDALDAATLDGHTLDELAAYFDVERQPTNFSIEASTGCQVALTALAQLGPATVRVLEAAAAAEGALPDGFVRDVMDRTAVESAGRGRLADRGDAGGLNPTDRALRGLIRAAGDDVPGVIIGACRFDGDVAVPGAASVTADISVAWGTNLHDAADHTRKAIQRALSERAGLTVTTIHINVQDVR